MILERENRRNEKAKQVRWVENIEVSPLLILDLGQLPIKDIWGWKKLKITSFRCEFTIWQTYFRCKYKVLWEYEGQTCNIDEVWRFLEANDIWDNLKNEKDWVDDEYA